MAKLSLCMIVKEKSDDLVRALDSLYDYVDEIVIATQDKSWVVSGSHAGPKWKVYHYDWPNDFAKARNDNFAKATGDYILWIDADDTVTNPEALPEIIKDMEKNNVDWCSLAYNYMRDEFGNIVMRHWKPRIMKKGSGKWEKTVHENWVPEREVTQIFDERVVIEHHIEDYEKHNLESGERNLKILLAEFNENPTNPDPRTLFYIGNTLMGLKKFEEAVPFYRDHITKCGWPEEKYYSLHYMSKCLSYVGEYDAAIEVGLEAIKLFPHWSLAYFDLGEYYSAKQDYPKVIEWIKSGMEKERPDAKEYFMDDTEYVLLPLGRLADAYMELHDFDRAWNVVQTLQKTYPNDGRVKEQAKLMKEIREGEQFVKEFIHVAGVIANKSRILGAKLFECLPTGLDADIRIQDSRRTLVPPKNWSSTSIVIYCGQGNGAEWAPPSIATGLGGSENAVVYLSKELAKLGYEVTVYNKCGAMRGIYDKVAYEPYYAFNDRDNFNILVGWRMPGLFNLDLIAKKKIVWMHDLSYPQFWNPKSIESVDKVVFLSEHHRSTAPEIPDEKVFISNNGIPPVILKKPKRDPRKIIYASSYDRGLELILERWMKIRKAVPDATLSVFYGWDNFLRDFEHVPDRMAWKAKMDKLMEQDGITHLGRIGHGKVQEEMETAGIWLYPAHFQETNCIVAQQAMAFGAIPVVAGYGALKETVKYGVVVPTGDFEMFNMPPELADKIIDEAIDMLHDVTRQGEIAKEMQPWAAENLTWEKTARHWAKELL